MLRADKYQKYKHNEKERERKKIRNNMCSLLFVLHSYNVRTYTHNSLYMYIN